MREDSGEQALAEHDVVLKLLELLRRSGDAVVVQTLASNDGHEGIVAAYAAARANARSSTRATSVSKSMPAASAAWGSSEVSVSPGIALTSST